MARPPKGKPLTMRAMRLDDDVWAECQRLGKEHGTINEGIAVALAALQMQGAQGRLMAQTGDPWKAVDVNPEINPASPIRRPTFKGPILRPKDKKK